MPNITVNRLKITGPKFEIQKCINSMDNKKGNIFDLNKIIQMPYEIENKKLEDSSDEDSILKLRQIIVANRKNKKRCKLAKEFLKAYEKPQWYQWAIQNWGTRNTVDATGKWLNDDHFEYIIDTPWNAPVEAIYKLAQKYPSLSFTMESIEPIRGSAIILKCQNGQQVEKNEYCSRNKIYKKLLKDILKINPAEFEN